MEASPQTWHYGIVAEWWSSFNDDFRSHEIPYYRAFLEDDGLPALDAGCGAGRLLIPFLEAGMDVDGCDVSADMIAVCQEKAANSGLAPNLYVQAMHALDLPRKYQTIFVCGAFGLGSNRARDAQALTRLRDHLLPGGTLLIDIEVPYADSGQWPYWLKENRASLPEAHQPAQGRRQAPDGSEMSLSTRIVDLDPLNQHLKLEIHAERWRGGELEAEEDRMLDIGLYFKNEMLLMLERAGFGNIILHGEHKLAEPTPSDDFLVFQARE
jgi:SAM-dependent methyltransferase